jgi:hypothetical protein
MEQVSETESPVAAPWAQRPRATIGDRNPEALFCAVGAAMTMWENIEGEFSTIYANLTTERPWHKAKYFKTPSFEIRSKMLVEISQRIAEDATRIQFLSLVELAQKFSFRRNDIAHGIVFKFDDNNFILGPSKVMMRNYPDSKASYQFNSQDVYYFVSQFMLIKSKVEALRAAIIESLP